MAFKRNPEAKLDTITFEAQTEGETPAAPIRLQEWPAFAVFRFMGTISALLDVFFSYVKDQGGYEKIKWNRTALDDDGQPVLVTKAKTTIDNETGRHVALKDADGNVVPQLGPDGQPMMVEKKVVNTEMVTEVITKFMTYLDKESDGLYEAIDAGMVDDAAAEDGTPNLVRVKRMPFGLFLDCLVRIIILNFGPDSSAGNVVKRLLNKSQRQALSALQQSTSGETPSAASPASPPNASTPRPASATPPGLKLS